MMQARVDDGWSDDDWDDEEEDAETYYKRRRQRRRRQAFSLVLLICAALVLLLWNRIVIPVRSGEAGVLYRYFTGTDMTTIYREGVHIIWPFDRMYVYDVRFQTQERTFTLLTQDGLSVVIRLAIRFRPDIRLLPLLHVVVGPEYVQRIVDPEVQAVLRRTVGQYTVEQVYTSQQGFLETVVVGSLTKVEDRYVIIDDVLIRSVTLPEQLRQAIVRKSILGEEEEAYQTRLAIERLEAQRKEIDAGGIQRYQDIIKQSLTDNLLRWQGVQATRELATSPNAKTVVIGGGSDGLPIILGGVDQNAPTEEAQAPLPPAFQSPMQFVDPGRPVPVVPQGTGAAQDQEATGQAAGPAEGQGATGSPARTRAPGAGEAAPVSTGSGAQDGPPPTDLEPQVPAVQPAPPRAQ